MEEEKQSLCDDVLRDILRCMDGESLAMAACVNSGFRNASRDESLWEELCGKKWPSVVAADSNTRLKLIVSELGGFQKLYSDCSRLIDINSVPETSSVGSNSSHSDFASLVDVQFRGKTLFSRFVEGIPSADESSEWFRSCPFRIDLIQPEVLLDDDSDRDQEMSSSSSSYQEMKIWKEIWEGMKVSWILIDRKSKRVANLSSWRPVLGQRHWPTDRDFVLRYGCVVNSIINAPVECSIVLKCRRSSISEGIKITELSLQLKQASGADQRFLSGRESLTVLCQAVFAAKCRDEEGFLKKYRDLVKMRNESKIQEQRHDCCFDLCFLLVVIVTGFVLIARFFS